MSGLRRMFWMGLSSLGLPSGDVPATYQNPVPTSYGAAQTISSGGTYTINVESTNGSTPAVSVTTSQPVTLINCNIKGAGYLIHCSSTTPNIKVLNSRLIGGMPSSTPRRALIAGNFTHVQIEHCLLENTAGILVAGNYQGDSTSEQTIRVRYNQVRNIDGRLASGFETVQFFQTNTVRKSTFTDVSGVNYYDGVPHMEVRWNDVRNQPGLSHVEDNINIFNSRGTSASPMVIADNFIHGAYYWDWQATSYTGSGMIADSPGANKGNCTAYVNFERNTVVNSSNNDFGVAGGTHINFVDNVGLNKGYIDQADATRLGVAYATAASELKGYPGNIYVHSNYVAGVTSDITEVNHIEGIHGVHTFSASNPRWRNDGDLWSDAFGTITNRTTLAGEITEAVEANYRTIWENRKAANNVHVGVTP